MPLSAATEPAYRLHHPPGESLADWLARQGPSDVLHWLESMPPGIRRYVLTSWQLWGRPAQCPPPGEWATWLLMAGRGWGKNRTMSEQVHRWAETKPGSHGALVARTVADVRDTVVKGVSGILATAKPGNRCTYSPTNRLVAWANGTTAHTYSSEEPDLLRGHNSHWFLADEFATWKRTKAADGGTAWMHLRLGTRLDMNGPPQGVVGTTPRPTVEMRALLAEPGLVVTRGRTFDNATNLAETYLRQMVEQHGGTRIGRQELEGELLEDVQGAIINLSHIDDARLDAIPPDTRLDRVVVGVDPSGGKAEVGIAAAARAYNSKLWGDVAHVLVLRDDSLVGSPEEWASAAIRAYHATSADRVLGERNYGGDMVQSTLRTQEEAVSYQDVSATRGKAVRAEPCLALYEQGRVHHVGEFPKLETELCSFTPDAYEGEGSPNRADALVWCITDLVLRTRRRRFSVW